MASDTTAMDSEAAARLQAANRALERQNALLKRLIALYDRLTGMVLQGAAIPAITELFAAEIGCAVTVLDPLLQVLAESHGQPRRAAPRAPVEWAGQHPQLVRVLDALAAERRPLRIPPLPDGGLDAGYVMAPIVVGEDVLGYLAIREDAPDDERAELELQAVQYAATVYALALMRERQAADIASRLKGDLLEGLLLGQVGDEQQAFERARLLGHDPRAPCRVLVLVPEVAAGPAVAESAATLALQRRVLDALSDLVTRAAPGAPSVARRDEVVAVLAEPPTGTAGVSPAPTKPPTGTAGVSPAPAPAPAPAALAERLARQLALHFPTIPLTGGVSGPCHAPTELAAAYAQARRTVEAARRFGRRGQVLGFEELGIYQLLYQVRDPAELHRFAEGVLGALVAYDQKHRADFVHTLRVFLQHHGSLQRAARDLFVHVNTVGYRVQRIQTISGLNLESPEDRLLVQVALKILETPEAGRGPSADDTPATLQ